MRTGLPSRHQDGRARLPEEPSDRAGCIGPAQTHHHPMMTEDYDDPAPIRDADIEMAELQEVADRSARLRKRGICTHGWLQGPPGPPSAPRTDCICHHCGKTWPTVDEAIEEGRRLLE